MATVKKIKKAQTGKIQARGTSGDYYNIDTAGYSAGAKKFPAEVVRPRIIGKAKKLAKDVSRRKVDEAIKKKTLTDSPTGFKKGGKVKKAQNGDGVFAPMTLNKDQAAKLKNTIKQRKASADSSISSFNRKLQEAKSKLKPKAKTGTKISKKK